MHLINEMTNYMPFISNGMEIFFTCLAKTLGKMFASSKKIVYKIKVHTYRNNTFMQYL